MSGSTAATNYFNLGKYTRGADENEGWTIYSAPDGEGNVAVDMDLQILMGVGPRDYADLIKAIVEKAKQDFPDTVTLSHDDCVAQRP